MTERLSRQLLEVLPCRVERLPSVERDTECARPCRQEARNLRQPEHPHRSGVITSQNDTAPKQLHHVVHADRRVITSQNDTAPKPRYAMAYAVHGVITSQNDTAPKQEWYADLVGDSVITSQNDTAPKLDDTKGGQNGGVITSQNDTAPKLNINLVIDLHV